MKAFFRVFPWLLSLGLGAWVALLNPDLRLADRLRGELVARNLLPAPVGVDEAALPVKAEHDPSQFLERYRIEADLDGDGWDDRLLSAPIGQFGNSGGQWTVLLHRDGGYREVGEISAHPLAISLEPDPDRILVRAEDRFHARIWIYLRGGASQGVLGYHRVGEAGVADLVGIDLDMGEGRVGLPVYEAVFRASPIPFRRERSVTTPDGTVTWIPDDAGATDP